MNTFEIDIAKFVGKTRIRADLVLGRITLGVFKDVVMKTPVDTGRARANWMPSWGSPLVDTSGGVDPSGGATISRINGTIASKPKTGWDAYLSNSLPYIIKLEYGLYPNPPQRPTGKTSGGYSIQAPQGMVRVTLAAWSESMVKALIPP